MCVCEELGRLSYKVIQCRSLWREIKSYNRLEIFAQCHLLSLFFSFTAFNTYIFFSLSLPLSRSLARSAAPQKNIFFSLLVCICCPPYASSNRMAMRDLPKGSGFHTHTYTYKYIYLSLGFLFCFFESYLWQAGSINCMWFFFPSSSSTC